MAGVVGKVVLFLIFVRIGLIKRGRRCLEWQT